MIQNGEISGFSFLVTVLEVRVRLLNFVFENNVL